MISADTNLFLYSANSACPQHGAAKRFFETLPAREFVICELVLVEIYMQLRNPAVLRAPLTTSAAVRFCNRLKSNPGWQWVDYQPEVAGALWQWASKTKSGFRHIIDARLALTLRHHGVKAFATANVKDFRGFGFDRVWNPLLAK